jgi:hypothetical protein
MATTLLILILIFSLLNFALLLPLVKVVGQMIDAMQIDDEPSLRRDRSGLMDIETPQINYHNLIPPPPKDLD